MPDPHSKNLRLHRLRDAPSTFFVTKSLRPKRPVLGSELRQINVEAFAFAVQHERIYLRAFVVMPDHWHALLGLREPWTLPKFMHALMSHVGAQSSMRLTKHQTAWQDGYYETLIKTARQFMYVAIYIEENPVKKGLVTTPEEWEESSAARKDLVTDQWPWVFDS
ncbi:MAG TPA: transposase [Chthoniobacterales bacterium]|nr:transposase [Chthoniobacterales bacterium]